MKTKYFKIILILLATASLTFPSCSNSINPDKNVNIGIYPNPFSNIGYITLQIPQQLIVSITIADTYGREIKKIFENRSLISGVYVVRIEFTNQPSGIYNCILNAGGKVYIQQFTVIK